MADLGITDERSQELEEGELSDDASTCLISNSNNFDGKSAAPVSVSNHDHSTQSGCRRRATSPRRESPVLQLFGKTDMDSRKNSNFGIRPSSKIRSEKFRTNKGGNYSRSSPSGRDHVEYSKHHKNAKQRYVLHGSSASVKQQVPRVDSRRKSKPNFHARTRKFPRPQYKQAVQPKTNNLRHNRTNSVTKRDSSFSRFSNSAATYPAEKHRPGNFHTLDQGASYQDLLDQYRLIKLELGWLKKEEEKRTEKSSEESRHFDSRHVLSTSTRSGNDKENKHQRRYSRSPSKGKEKLARGESILIPKNDKIKAQHSPLTTESSCNEVQSTEALKSPCEEEEDEMELRRMALASRSKEMNTKKQDSQKENVVEPVTPSKRRVSRDDLHKKSSSPSLDNYESVDMDLDSDCAAQATDLSEVEMDTSDDNMDHSTLDDEDEQLLREELLKSLERRRNLLEFQRLSLKGKPSKVQVEVLLKEENLNVLLKEDCQENKCALPIIPEPICSSSPLPVVPELSMPTLVINLGEDSTSEESETEENQNGAPAGNNFLDGLNSLLKEERQKAEKVPGLNSTPAAVSKLSNAQQLEYRKLKAEIAKRELHQQPKQPVNAGSSAATEGAAEQLCAEQKKYLDECEQNLKTERVSLLKERERLSMLQQLMNKRQRLVEMDTERLEKLRQQVETAEASLSKNKSFVMKIGGLVQGARNTVSRHILTIPKLERECSQAGKCVHGAQYKVPTVSIRPHPVKRRLSVSADLSKKQKVLEGTVVSHKVHTGMSSAELLAEKGRLQKMEQDIAQRLKELRSRSKTDSPKLTLPEPTPKGSSDVNESAKGIAITNVDLKGLKEDVSLPTLASTFIIERCVKETNPTSTLTLQADLLHLDPKESFKMPSVESKILPINLILTTDCLLGKLSRLKTKLSFSSLPAKHVLTNTCEMGCPGYKQYKSSLLHVSSYRLNPRFKSESKQILCSNSFTNKVIPKVQLCKFDLTGTCNDDQCKWQHSKNYHSSTEDIIAELVSFCPEISSVLPADSQNKSLQRLYSYASDVLSNASQEPESILESLSAEICQRLHLAPPHYIQVYKRRRKLIASVPLSTPSEPVELGSAGKGITGVHVRRLKYEDEDSVVDPETDVRYFEPRTGLDALEEFLQGNPSDIRLWLKLASHHMNRPNGGLEALNHALDVLSRALETNRDNVELWQRYLALFSCHPDSVDILALCQQALEFTKEYPIWWKYLELSEGFENKSDVCCQLLTFLLSNEGRTLNPVDEDVSHRLLEVSLYFVQLHLQTGRIDASLALFRDILSASYPEELPVLPESCSMVSKIFPYLSGPDQALLWLCFFHVVVHKTLPATLFLGGTHQPSNLVQKEAFTITIPKGLPEESVLVSLVQQAISSCSMKGSPDDIWPLHLTLIQIHIQTERMDLAVEVCRTVCQATPSLSKAWTHLSYLHCRNGDPTQAEKVLEDALQAVPMTPELCNTLAIAYLNCNSPSAALQLLTDCVKPYFQLQDSDVCGIALLYRILLNHSTGEDEDLNVPQRLKNVELVESDLVHMWLNYALYSQQTQAVKSLMVDIFESALVSVKLQADVELIWLRYFVYTLSCSGGDSECMQEFVFQCLNRVSARHPFPHWPGRHHLNHNFHNTIIDMYCQALDSAESVIAFCEESLQLLPKNPWLLKRLVLVQLEEEGSETALRTLLTHIGPNNTCDTLWRMAISFAVQEMDLVETRKLCHRAVQVLPYSHLIWMDLIKLESQEEKKSSLETLLKTCRHLGILEVDQQDLATPPSPRPLQKLS